MARPVSPNREVAPSRTTRGLLIALALVLALGLALRLYHLGHDSFWIDEVSSMAVAEQPLGDIVLNYRPGHHPWHGAEQAPLALVVMHLFLSPAAREASARLPSAVLGVGGILVLFLFARRVFPAPVPLLAGLFLTLSPLHVWYSQEARWYALWLFLTTLSYWALLDAWRTGRPRAWVAYWVCTVLNVYTFVLSFLVIACQGVSVLLLDRRRIRAPVFPRFILAQVAVLFGAAPVVWMIVKTMGLTTGTPRPIEWVELPYTFFTYAAGYSAGPTVGELHALPSLSSILAGHLVVVIFAAVFAPLLVLGVRRVVQRPLAAIILVPWCFGPALLAFGVALASNVTYQARYSSVALPAFLLLVALGCLSLKRSAARWGAIAAVAACFASSLANYYWDPHYAKEDAKGAVAYITATGLDHLPVAVVGQVDPAVAYYGPGLDVIPVDTCNGAAFEHQSLGAAFNDRRGLWLVVGRDWNAQASSCLSRLSHTHTSVDHRRLPGIDLWLFEPTKETSAGGLSNEDRVAGRHSGSLPKHMLASRRGAAS
ncbi:MAG: glycosyltransferase family 39 protein [Candidatus Binatia bacterium]